MALIKILEATVDKAALWGTVPTWHRSGRSSWLSEPREDFQSITGLSSRKGRDLEGTWGSWSSAVSELHVSKQTLAVLRAKSQDTQTG